MVLPDRSAERSGYRLPTEAEWEHVCRAGTVTTRHFGVSDELFPRYGWTWLNSLDRARLVGQLLPNPYGLFDMLGNLWEWCHDGRRAEKEDRPYPYPTRYDRAESRSRRRSRARSSPRSRAGCSVVVPLTARPPRPARRIAILVPPGYSEATYGFRVVRTLPPGRQ